MSVRRTDCRVKIVTPDTPELGKSRTYEFEAGMSADDGDLVAAKVETYLDRMPSTFVLTFAYNRVHGSSWSSLIPQKSLVMVWMSNGYDDDGDSWRPGGESGAIYEELVMVGLTEPPQDSERYSSAGLVRTSTVVGRGIESVLEDARVWMAPFLELHKHKISDRLENTAIKQFNEILGGRLMWAREIYTKDMTPLQALLAMYAYYISNHKTSLLSIGLPPGYTISEILLPGSVSREKLREALKEYRPGHELGVDPAKDCDWTYVGDLIDEKLMFPTGGHNPGGSMSLLSMMHRASDANMHDFYVEYSEEDGRPTARIRHRVKPYDPRFSVKEFMREKRTLFMPVGTSVNWSGLLEGFPWVDELDEVDELIESIGSDRPSYDGWGGDFGHAHPNQGQAPTTENVTGKSIISLSLTHGTKPIYNIFWAMPGDGSLIRPVVAKAEMAPEVCGAGSPSDVARHGVKPLEYKLPWFAVEMPNKDDKETAALVRALQKIQRTLKGWFEPNPILQSGNIVVSGSARFRPGKRLYWKTIDDRGAMEFEISAVSHSYSFADGAFVTTMAVRRGWNIDQSMTSVSSMVSGLTGTMTEEGS